MSRGDDVTEAELICFEGGGGGQEPRNADGQATGSWKWRGNRFSPDPPEGPSPAHSLISPGRLMLILEPKDITFLLLRATVSVVTCYSSNRKRIHHTRFITFHRKVTCQMMAFSFFLCFCPSDLDELSQSGYETWGLGCSSSPGTWSQCLIVYDQAPLRPCGRGNSAKRLPLSPSRAGRETSCVLAEVRLPVCCRG